MSLSSGALLEHSSYEDWMMAIWLNMQSDFILETIKYDT